MRTRNSLALALAAVASLLAASAKAADLSAEYHLEGSYVTDASFKRGDARVGSVSQFDTRALFVLSAPVTDTFLLRLGAQWQRYEFDRPAGAPIPGVMQSLNFIVGADFSIGQSWLFRIDAQPGFSGTTNDLDADSARIPVVIGASYIYSADLQFVAGVGIDANRKYLLLPGIGLRWKVSEHWVINGVLPAPRLEYSPNRNLQLYAGGEFRQDTYRVNEPLGGTRGLRPLEGTIIDYWEMRAGAGFAWKARPGVNVELEGGVVPLREFDFHRAGERVRGVETPGYFRLAVRGSF